MVSTTYQRKQPRYIYVARKPPQPFLHRVVLNVLEKTCQINDDVFIGTLESCEREQVRRTHESQQTSADDQGKHFS